MEHHQLLSLSESFLMGLTRLALPFKYLPSVEDTGLKGFWLLFENYYLLRTKFEMTRSVNKRK